MQSRLSRWIFISAVMLLGASPSFAQYYEDDFRMQSYYMNEQGLADFFEPRLKTENTHFNKYNQALYEKYKKILPQAEFLKTIRNQLYNIVEAYGAQTGDYYSKNILARRR